MTNVVMLHGWGMSASVFDEVARTLSARHNVSTPDLPGYGGSASCERYTLERIALHLAERSPDRCVVVGWSLGAQVALAWARARPEQVEALALIAATPCFVQREDWRCAMEPAVFEAFAEALVRDCRATLARFLSLQAHGDDDEKCVIQRLRTTLSRGPVPEPAVLEQGLRILRECDLRSALGAIAQRALVVRGEHDQLVPRAASEFLARNLQRARLEVVPGAAHAPFVSQPEATGRMLAELFDER